MQSVTEQEAPAVGRRGGVYTSATLLLAAVVGLSFIGLGFVMPLRSLYAREAGASSGEVGLMASSFLLASFLAAPLAGWCSDRFGYTRVLWIGLALRGLITLAYIPAGSAVFFIALRAVDGAAAAAVLPPARALMNGLAPRDRQGEALGMLSAAQMGGVLLGPPAGTFLAASLGYSPSFVVASVALYLGALSVPLFLRGRTGMRGGVRPVSGSPLTGTFTRPLVLAYLLRGALAMPGGAVVAVWSLYMLDRGGSLVLLGLSFTAFAVPSILLAPLVGRLSDTYGRYWPILLGTALAAVVYLAYGTELSPMVLVITSLLEGAVLTAATSAVDGLLADHAPPDARGRVQANYSAAGTAGSFLSATVAGFAYAIAPGVPFVLVSVVLLVTVAALLLPGPVRVFRLSTVTGLSG